MEFFKEKRSASGRRYSCKKCDHARKVRYLTGLSLEQWEKQKLLRKTHYPSECAYKREYRRKRLWKALMMGAKTRAIKLKLPFDLDKHADQLKERVAAMKCEMTRITLSNDMEMDKRKRAFNTPSIDRINPQMGYVYSNIRIVCWGINCAMSDWGEATLFNIITAWLAHRED